MRAFQNDKSSAICEMDSSHSSDVSFDDGECRDSSFEYDSDGGSELIVAAQEPVYNGNCYMFEPEASASVTPTVRETADSQLHEQPDLEVGVGETPISRLGRDDW